MSKERSRSVTTSQTRPPTPFMDEIWETLQRSPLVSGMRPVAGIAQPFGIEAKPNTFWVMSPQRAEAIAIEVGVEFMSMRGTRLLGIPVLFSDDVPEPILVSDDPESPQP